MTDYLAVWGICCIFVMVLCSVVSCRGKSISTKIMKSFLTNNLWGNYFIRIFVLLLTPRGGTKGSGLHPQRVYSNLPYIFL